VGDAVASAALIVMEAIVEEQGANTSYCTATQPHAQWLNMKATAVSALVSCPHIVRYTTLRRNARPGFRQQHVITGGLRGSKTERETARCHLPLPSSASDLPKPGCSIHVS
jgi:hypothetical protein